MERQPIPPQLEYLVKQLADRTQSPQYRENVANRLEDVASALMEAVAKFRGQQWQKKKRTA
jgi:hypothetical protein